MGQTMWLDAAIWSPRPLAGEGGERSRAGRGLLYLRPSPPSHSLGTLSPLRGARGLAAPAEPNDSPHPFPNPPPASTTPRK